MGCRCGLGAPSFEIHDGKNLQLLPCPAMANVSSRALGIRLVEHLTDSIDVIDRVHATPVWLGLGTVAFGNDLAKISFMNADKVRGFAGSEQAHALLRRRRKGSELVRTKLP